MEHRKMTNSEVVKALRSCASGTCNRCPREFVFENGPECRAHLEQAAANRLENCIYALTLPDGTVLDPSDVAALRARCAAAERDIRELLAQPDYVGVCWACAKVSTPHSECDPQWRGPQEGATAHERV